MHIVRWLCTASNFNSVFSVYLGFQIIFNMMWSWFKFSIVLVSMRSLLDTRCCHDELKQQGQFTAAILTSDNLTLIQTATAQAIKGIEKSVNGTKINVVVFYLEKLNISLRNSLVQFCHQVITKNIASVIITEELRQGRFNFIPWISSYLGITVALLRNTRGFSTKQIDEYGMVYSLKPDNLQQTTVVSGILSFFRWTNVLVISDTTKQQLVGEFVRRLERLNPILLTTVELVDTSEGRDLTAKMTRIKRFDTSAIILLLVASQALKLLHEAEKLGLFSGNHAWVVSEEITEGTSRIPRLPAGLLGIRLHRSCDSTLHTSLPDLLYDGLMVFTHSQKAFIETKGIISANKHYSCYADMGNRNTTRNKAFFRQITDTKLIGKTGRIQFDRFGNRIHPEYDIMNLQTKSNGEKGWIKVGYWNKKELLCNKVSIQWPGNRAEPPTNILRTKVLSVVTAITQPFSFLSALNEHHIKGGMLICGTGLSCKTYQLTPNGSYTIKQKCCKGLAIDLLAMLENDLGFKADLHVVKDGKYGALQKGKWNGMIGELVRGEADLAIADLTITDSRSQAVDFTHPFLHSGTNILVTVRVNRKGWLLRFLDPFSTELWVLSIVSINIIFILLWLIDRKSPFGHYRKGKDYKERKKFHLIASLWFSWGTVFHIDECETRPRSYSSRLITVFFAFGMLVLTNTYTANLAAVLVSEGEVLPISGIQDPKLQNPPQGFTLATVADTSLERLFKGSQDAVYSQIWRHMKPNTVKTFAEGVQKVVDGQLTAFIGDQPTLLYHISKHKSCNLKLAGKPFFQSWFGLALPKNSTLTKRFSKVLIQYEQLDTSLKLTKRWLHGSCGGNKDSAKFKRMSFGDVGGACIILPLGVLVSILVFVIEFHVDRFGFPLSHIWTNKPHRSWLSTRELYRKGLLGKRSETFTSAPLELMLSERRVTPSMRDPWNSFAVNGPQNDVNRRFKLIDLEMFSGDASRHSFNGGFDDDCEEKSNKKDSGRSSLSQNTTDPTLLQ